MLHKSEPIFAFLFHLFFFPAIVFFLTYFSQYFAHGLAIFFYHESCFSGLYNISECTTAVMQGDCSIRVSQSFKT